ncbi:MAG: RHS repeat-associated core domain-containing protein [Planctomycetota bacterium]
MPTTRTTLVLALLLASPVLAAERDDEAPVRPTVLDLSGLDRIDVEPFSGALLYEREDLALGDGPDLFRLVRTWSAWGGDALHFGFHWASPLDLRVELDPKGERAVLIDERGFPLRFKLEGGQLRSVEGRPLTLERRDGGLRILGREPGEELRFDGEGRALEKLQDGRSVLRYRYRDGLLVELEGAWGRLELVRDGESRLVQLRGPAKLRIGLRRDARGDLVEVSRGRTYAAYGYDEDGLLDAIAGGQARVTRDELGRVTELGGAGVQPVRVAYETTAMGTRSEVTRGPLRWTLERSADGLRLERRHPGGAKEVLTLDPRRRPRLRTMEDQRWAWEYDPAGHLVRYKSPEGETLYRYRDSDKPSGIRLPSGLALAFQYDARGLLTGAKHPALGVYRARYDAAGRVIEQVDGRGARVRFAYDGRGYLTAVDDPAGHTALTRGEDGELREVRDPSGRVTRIASEGEGRLVRITNGDELVTEVAYDRRGRVTRETRDGRTVHYRWGLKGELLQALDAVGALASFRYDEAGRFAAIEDGAGHAVRYTHPDALTTVIDDDTSGRSVIRRDALGRVVEEVRGGASVRYRYDDASRVVSRVTPAGEDTFVYGAHGRMLRQQGPAGGFRLEYDEAGRLARLEQLGLGQAIRYRYDEAGDRVAAELPWGRVEYRHDAQGRLSGLTTAEGQRIELEHLPDGRRSAIRYPNGVVTRFEYQGSRLTRIESKKGDDTLSLRAYRYDAEGRVAAIEDEAGRTVRYERDARGRLVRALQEGRDERFTWDLADNLLPAKSEVGAGNRLVRAGERRYQYDARGALAAIEGPEGKTHYAYDADGHLVSARLPKGETVRYGYAPNGTRLWREGQDGRTELLSDLSDVVGEYRAGKLERSFVHGDGVDDVLSMRQDGRSYYYHYDQVRSVVALSDARGQVAARYRYSAFGETLAAEGSVAQDNPFRFTSRPLDRATGLYDLRARSYAPGLGRFTSPDPAGREGGLNLYGYAAADPTRWNDPWGLWPAWLDTAVNKVSDVASRAANSVVELAKSNPVTNAIYEGYRLQYNFVKGFGKGLYDGVAGIVTMVLHPVQTVKDIKWAVEHWDEVKAALGDKWDEYQQAWKDGDWNKVAEMTGYVLGQVTASFVGTKGIDKIAKIGAVGKAARVIAATRPVQAVARTARTVSGALAPVRAAAAPLLRPVAAVARPLGTAARVVTKPFDWTAEKLLDGAIWTGDKLSRPVRQVAGAALRRARGPVVAPVAGVEEGAILGGNGARLGQGARLGGEPQVQPKVTPGGNAPGNGGAVLGSDEARLGQGARLGGERPNGGRVAGGADDGYVVVEKGDARGMKDKLLDPDAKGGKGTTYRNVPGKAKPANAVHDEAYTASKHTRNGAQVERDLRRGRDAHVFNDEVNLKALEDKVWNEGVYHGTERGWERWSYTSDEPIGMRLQNGRDPVPLRTVEIKGRPTPDGGYEYHLVPRSKPVGPAVAPTTTAPEPVAAPVEPPKPHGDLYRGAREAWSEPVPANSMANLQNRWKAIDEQAKRLAQQQQNLTPAQRQALAQAEDALRAERAGKSGTVAGKHGAVSGTDGASIATANWNKAEQMVADWARRGEPLTVDKIKQINAVLGEGLQNNGYTPGVLRSGNLDVSAGGSPLKTYVPAKDVSQAMDDFIKWYDAAEKAGMPPVELAARSYQRLVSIHPFPDANGRTTRMVMDYVLQKNGLPPATLDNVNVAVFGSEGAYGIKSPASASPEQAIDAVTKGVERSLEHLNKAAGTP